MNISTPYKGRPLPLPAMMAAQMGKPRREIKLAHINKITRRAA